MLQLDSIINYSLIFITLSISDEVTISHIRQLIQFLRPLSSLVQDAIYHPYQIIIF